MENKKGEPETGIGAQESDPHAPPVRGGLLPRFLNLEVRMEKIKLEEKKDREVAAAGSAELCRKSNFRRPSWQGVKEWAIHSLVLLLLGTHEASALSSRTEGVGALTISSNAQ